MAISESLVLNLCWCAVLGEGRGGDRELPGTLAGTVVRWVPKRRYEDRPPDPERLRNTDLVETS